MCIDCFTCAHDIDTIRDIKTRMFPLRTHCAFFQNIPHVNENKTMKILIKWPYSGKDVGVLVIMSQDPLSERLVESWKATRRV